MFVQGGGCNWREKLPVVQEVAGSMLVEGWLKGRGRYMCLYVINPIQYFSPVVSFRPPYTL